LSTYVRDLHTHHQSTIYRTYVYYVYTFNTLLIVVVIIIYTRNPLKHQNKMKIIRHKSGRMQPIRRGKPRRIVPGTLQYPNKSPTGSACTYIITFMQNIILYSVYLLQTRGGSYRGCVYTLIKVPTLYYDVI